MKFSIAALSIIPFASTVFGNGLVYNNCPFPVYVRVNNNAQVGTIQPRGTFNQGPGSGIAIKLGTQPQLSAPLTFEYSVTGSTVYYDVSNAAGNPFNAYRTTLTPAIQSCAGFNCGPSSPGCYSNGASPKVKACQNNDITVRLCA